MFRSCSTLICGNVVEMGNKRCSTDTLIRKNLNIKVQSPLNGTLCY